VGVYLQIFPVNLAPKFFLRPGRCTRIQCTPWLHPWISTQNMTLKADSSLEWRTNGGENNIDSSFVWWQRCLRQTIYGGYRPTDLESKDIHLRFIDAQRSPQLNLLPLLHAALRPSSSCLCNTFYYKTTIMIKFTFATFEIRSVQTQNAD